MYCLHGTVYTKVDTLTFTMMITTSETKEDKGNAIINRMVCTAVDRMGEQIITKEE